MTSNYPPLINKYFAKHFNTLHKAQSSGYLTKPYFVDIASDPDLLEARLQRIESLNVTQQIISEIGGIGEINADELDRRLLDAWAELRVVDQLAMEHFINLKKVQKTADIIGTLNQEQYAVQIKHISVLLKQYFEKQSDPRLRNNSPYYDSIDGIYERFTKPLSDFFYDAISKKNDKFEKWEDKSFIRCIAIVTSDSELQVNLVRHIACRQISEIIHDLPMRNFEELLWFPDTGNGAWFKIGNTKPETHCYVQWESTKVGETVERKILDLNSDTPNRR